MKDKTKKNIISFLDWLVSILCYSIILLLASLIFKKTIVVETQTVFPGFWFLMATLIIYILNKTIKPLIVWLTLPLTGLTMGLFYPFINVLFLYITDFLLGKNFEIHGIIMAFILAIFISIVNILVHIFLINPVIKKEV